MLGWLCAHPEPLRFWGFAVDRMGAVLALLVTGIGAVCLRYSVRCLDGHPRRDRFLCLLTGAVLSATALVCASNLLLLVAAWTSSSLFLHGLLTFCRERPECRRPAWKKFLISRIGDVALAAAVLSIARGWHTTDLGAFLAAAADAPDASGLTVPVLCLVLAALTKSAQFPFHSWLPETMESPTPVSALMHAGIINAGGVLLIRFAPAIARVPEAWLLLSAVGTVTLSVGMVSMWAQVKAKRTLAWSTVSQMGFMMVQCGLLAVPAALLHVVGHGCCKAWSFLSAGEVGHDRMPRASVRPLRALALVAAGCAASVPAVLASADLTGVHLAGRPGELALAAILSLAVGQLWSALLGPDAGSVRAAARRAAAALAVGSAAVLAAFGLYRAVGAFLAPGPQVQSPSGPAAWCAAAMPVVACIALTVLHALLPVLHRWGWGRSLRVHALHGFYMGAVADRLVDAVTFRDPAANLGGRHA
jgi:NAD(P)H-quinone oxidoreductase subunit 5